MALEEAEEDANMKYSLFLMILLIGSNAYAQEGELANRTAYYLDMKSCIQGRETASINFNKLQADQVDSIYYFTFGNK